MVSMESQGLSQFPATHRTCRAGRCGPDQPNVCLKELAPLEQVRTVSHQVVILYKFQKIAFRIPYENRIDSLPNVDCVVTDQIHMMSFEPSDHLVHVRHHEREIGDSLALENPFGIRALPKSSFLGLD